MSSLWTPDGEHRVRRPGETGSGAGAPTGPGAPGAPGSAGPPGSPARPGGDVEPEPLSEEDLAAEEELVRIAQHIAAAPAEDVVANHCYGLFELGAIHLSQQPPQLDKARLAIDALSMLVDGLGARLGQHAQALADGLMQLRLAFASIANAVPASDGQGGGVTSPSE